VQEELLLKRQRVPMFCSIAPRVMKAAQWLDIQDLGQPPAPEADGAFLLFFEKLTEKLLDAAGRLTKVVDAECRELLGLAGTCIFTNLQRQCPELDLLDVLRKVWEVPAAGPLDRQAAARAAQVNATVERLLAIYERPGARAGTALVMGS
jgi:hypothetical protein